MSSLEITSRYSRALGTRRADDAPPWIDTIDNPYLHGLFAPTTKEFESGELTVLEGAIPPDLFGAYFRNGPNAMQAPINRYHWFDGDGLVHGIWFEDGKARYRSKLIETKALGMEREKGDAIWPGVLGPFDMSLPFGPIKDTANTDLLYFKGELLALWYESGRLHAMDPRTLASRGTQTFGETLKIPVSAHSKVCPETGDLLFFSYGDRPPFMRYGVVRADGAVHQTEITLPGPRRPHDLGVTRNHSIVHDFPLFFDPEYFKRTGKRVPLFHPEVPTRYGVIPRFGTDADVKWFDFKPCYMLHTVNCWEEGDWVVMVGCRTKAPVLNPDPRDGKIAAMLNFLKLQANLYEWRMNVKTGESSERDLSHLNAEFPMIHGGWLGRKNRYSYHQIMPYDIPATFEGVAKYDLHDASYERYDYPTGVFGSETPFAPARGTDARDPAQEDHGYLLSFVTDVSDWSSACWIFDARSLSAGPVAKVALPGRVPAGFHSIWVDGADL